MIVNHNNQPTSITIKEFDELKVDEPLLQEDFNDIKNFALDNQQDTSGNYRPILKVTNKKLQAQNYVGVIQTTKGTVIEILPKIFNETSDIDKTKATFYKMLRTWRRFKNASYQSDSNINALKNFPMLEVFIRLFIDNLVVLTRRGLARQYELVQDNLPYLKGRLLLAQQLKYNLTNQAQFYVEYDEFNANRPANRLIHSTINALLKQSKQSKNKQLLRQLQADFDDIPLSQNYHADWQKHRIDRSMQHYAPVMQWVGLFLFNQGLTTYQGQHLNQCLLFPMEQIFEDYVAHCFTKNPNGYKVMTQPKSKHLALEIDSQTGKQTKGFQLRPDLILEKNNSRIVLDTKWKLINKPDQSNHGISQSDMYQLYAYGKKYNADHLVLIYPLSEHFTQPIHYDLNTETQDSSNSLMLYCVPFDCNADPKVSIDQIINLPSTSYYSLGLTLYQ